MRRFLFVLLLFVPVFALAQAPVVGAYSEAMSVEVVNVDVVVVDRDGNPVTDLVQGDFELLVNGKPVEISNFSAYFTPAQLAATAKATPAAPATEAAPQVTAPAPPVEAPPATFLVYVDLLRTPRFQRALALRQVQKFLEGTFRPQDRALVAAFDGDALRVLQPLTSDFRVAAQAMKKLELRPQGSREFAPLEIDNTAMSMNLSEEERERRVRAALHGLRDLLGIVNGLEGRVALLMVGGGYKWTDLPDDRGRRIRTEYEKVLESLSNGRVTAYTIFSGPERFVDGFTAGTMADSEPTVDSAPPDFGNVGTASGLAAFADVTGGLALGASSDLESRLVRVRNDLDGYYSLGFRSRLSQGERLNVDVRVRREGLRVRHREAVRLRTDTESAQDATMAALLDDSQVENPWKVAVGVPEVKPAGRNAYRARVEIRVPLTEVMFVPQNDRHYTKLLFHFAVRDPKGNYRQLDSREQAIAVPAAEFANVRKQSIRYSLEVAVLPGENAIAVTVADATGRGRSTTSAPIRAGGRR